MTMAAAKKTARKAAPRKARPRANVVDEAVVNGATANGDVPIAPAPPAPEPAEPEPVAPEDLGLHPLYGARQIYTYQPLDGSPSIEFPHISTVAVTPKFFWRIYRMNEMFQSFEWMDQAQVPRFIQERVMDLPDAEKGAFFEGWFKEITSPQGVAPPGES